MRKDLLLFLIFWGGAILLIFVSVFAGNKFGTHWVKKEISLPNEYMELLNEFSQGHGGISGLKAAFNPEQLTCTIFTGASKILAGGLTGSPQASRINYSLTSIIVSPEKKLCFFNGKPYKIGDKLGSYQITEIGEYYVYLKGPKGKIKVEVGGSLNF